MSAAERKVQFEEAEQQLYALQSEKDAAVAEYKTRLVEARKRRFDAEEAWRRAVSEERQATVGG